MFFPLFKGLAYFTSVVGHCSMVCVCLCWSLCFHIFFCIPFCIVHLLPVCLYPLALFPNVSGRGLRGTGAPPPEPDRGRRSRRWGPEPPPRSRAAGRAGAAAGDGAGPGPDAPDRSRRGPEPGRTGDRAGLQQSINLGKMGSKNATFLLNFIDTFWCVCVCVLTSLY